MTKTTTLKIVGVLLGALMILGAFIRWDEFYEAMGGSSWQASDFLGLYMYSTDYIFGFDHFPIIAGAIFIISVALSDKSIYVAILAGVVSGLCFLLAVYNLIHRKTQTFRPGASIEVRTGLYLTLIASLLALLTVFLIRRSLSQGALRAQQ